MTLPLMKSKILLRLAVMAAIAAMVCGADAAAQRRVNPVRPKEPYVKPDVITATDAAGKAQNRPTRPSSVVKQVDDSGREFYLDTITGSDWVDSAAMMLPKVVGNIYPLWDAVNVGVDVWDPLMRCFGQKYGLAGIWAELSLHNRYKPIVEFGLGCASTTPAAKNYTYNSAMAPYFKVGANYNFLYNSNSAYQVYAGLRYGITRFSYDLTDVTVANGYWQTESRFDIPSQQSTTGYLEVVLGLQVKIAGPLSAGWNIKYHRVLHSSAAPYGNAWYIPGYGSRGSALGVSLSVIYTIPIKRDKTDATQKTTDIDDEKENEQK